MLRRFRAWAPLIAVALLVAMLLPWATRWPLITLGVVALLGIKVWRLRRFAAQRALEEATQPDADVPLEVAVRRAASAWDARHGPPDTIDAEPDADTWHPDADTEEPWDDDAEPWRG